MAKFDFVKGLDFYDLLWGNDEFCMELGRVVLAAGRLESILKEFINKRSPNEKTHKATLGKLINIAKANEPNLSKNIITVLEELTFQRNYLTHNIHSLFIGQIEETVLESTNLTNGDVSRYIDVAWQLQESLNHLADVLAKGALK